MTNSSSAHENVRDMSSSVPTNINAYLLILSAGDIHIWDRGSAFLRHFIPAPTRETEGNAPEVMSLAWNTARRDVLFVTGRYDGSVKVWRSFDFKGPRGSETSPSSG